VSGATEVAKGSASAVLTREGLAPIVDLVKNRRAIYQRVVTWIVNEISRSATAATPLLPNDSRLLGLQVAVPSYPDTWRGTSRSWPGDNVAAIAKRGWRPAASPSHLASKLSASRVDCTSHRHEARAGPLLEGLLLEHLQRVRPHFSDLLNPPQPHG